MTNLRVEKENLITAKRRFVKNTPDKIRLAATLIKEKKLPDALNILKFSNLAAAKPLILTLKAASAMAKDKEMVEDNLYVLGICVDEGPKLKRRRIIHQGRATAILKRMSHITVVLSEQRKSKVKNQKSKIK